MNSKTNFENIVSAYLSIIRQHLLLGYLHTGIKKEIYEKNPIVWDTLLLSLEFSAMQALDNLLKNKDYFGDKFRFLEFDTLIIKIDEWRNNYTGHLNLPVLRNFDEFKKQNKMVGLEVLRLIVAMGKRLDAFDKNYKFGMNVEELFNRTKHDVAEDLKDWIRHFGIELGGDYRSP